MREYRTTIGTLNWDEPGFSIYDVDDPCPPDDSAWVMCGSVLGEMRASKQPILWFWVRDVPEA